MPSTHSVTRILTACAALCSVSALSACNPGDPDGGDAHDDSLSDRDVPRLPQADSRDPWGGPNPGSWAPEAVYANAVSRALNDVWHPEAGESAIVDAVVAVPAQVSQSQLFPYGDGQSNAAVSFESWSQPRPPVVATLTIARDGDRRVRLRFDRELPASAPFELRYTTGAGGHDEVTLSAERDAAGDWIAAWDPDTAAQAPVLDRHDAPMFVRPAGWSDWWAIHFHHPAYPVDELVADVPAELTAFADGRTIPDPERIAAAGRLPFDHLTSRGFGPGYNTTPYLASDIHGQFPGRPRPATAVGSSWAWVADVPAAPFKQLYLCMEGRSLADEASLGVPTGSGWHQIGDPAESLLNSLEGAPVLTGWGAPAGAPPSGGFAYGLGHVTTARWLHPGEALLTARADAPRYHWYLNHADRPLCAEIWVHPCSPSERFACGPVPVTFTASEAHTAPGQSVYVIGNVPELGEWDPARALPLDPVFYPTWMGTVSIAAGTDIQFKFIKRDSSGAAVWESGANRGATVPHAEWLDVGGAWR